MKYIQILIISIMMVLFSPATTYAHVLKIDGSVGAVIHVSPEDDPIARESTDFFFEFKDKEGKFTPDNCDCQGIIVQGGREIYSAPLFQSSSNPSLESASFSFTFPEKNVYKVRVSGKPTTPGAFNPFTLEWDIRVARESETVPATGSTQDQTTTGNNQNSVVDWISRYSPHLIGGFLIVGFVLFYLLKQKAKNAKSK